jgi:simple sugar transport system ATP-binding protein
VTSLFSLLRQLAEQGRAIVLVAHKIDEVLAVADRVTVLRRGRTVLTGARSDYDAAALIAAMVGGDVAGTLGARLSAAGGGGTPNDEIRGGEPVARLRNVSAAGESGSQALRDVGLTVARGEVVGIAGVEGNGQRELALVLAGRLVADSGTVEIPSGVGFIPQDRSVEGVIPDFDLVENMALALHDDSRYGRGAWLAWSRIRTEAESVVSRFGVVAPGAEALAGALSGGNQQRFVVGRELLRASDLLVAENPTRGLDVAATAFVHAEIQRLAGMDSGPGVVLVSTDLDEVLELSSRILVMSRGRLLEAPDDVRTREGIGTLMLGGGAGDA